MRYALEHLAVGEHFQPGSELFVLYNDERDTRGRGVPELTTRALIVKFNQLFRF